MIKEAIILAGGLGTRLREIVSDVPKCMAPIGGVPFLKFIIDPLIRQGIDRIVFSVGYKSEFISEFLEQNYSNLDYTLAVEAEPLGTGGAIKLACSYVRDQQVMVLNGDTFFDVDIKMLNDFVALHPSDLILCLKPMRNFERYGVVLIDGENRVVSFEEKRYYENGLINGGTYVLNVPSFNSTPLPEKFSFEKDYMEAQYHSKKIYGFVSDGYFIDIGIPADFERAQTELKLV